MSATFQDWKRTAARLSRLLEDLSKCQSYEEMYLVAGTDRVGPQLLRIVAGDGDGRSK